MWPPAGRWITKDSPYRPIGEVFSMFADITKKTSISLLGIGRFFNR